MEDILASIRRIIADEGTGSDAPKPFDNEPSGFDESTTFSEGEAEPDEGDDTGSGPDIEAEADSINVDEIDFDSISIDPEPDETDDDDGEDDLLELTDDMIADDRPPEPVDPISDDVAFDEIGPASDDLEPRPENDWPASEETEEPLAAAADDIDPERLMSPATDAMVGSAFGRLANAILSNEARTVEDLIKEMLRPMLREWIDDNLPQVVERLVREEIERVARGR